MSAEAVGYVYRHSPYEHSTFTVHLALADSANDQHGYELWARQEWIAGKARVSRQTVNRALKTMVEDGYLQVVEDNHGKPNRYRLLMPEHEPEWTPQGVTNDDTSNEEAVKSHDTQVSTDATAGVTNDDTEPKGEPKEEPNLASSGADWQHDPEVRANQLLAEHLDELPRRPPSEVVGITADRTKKLLDEGIPPDDIRGALHLLRSKGKHPAILPSLVEEHRANGRADPPPSHRVSEFTETVPF